MSSKNLALYLNDHLAGSVGARELLANLGEAYRGQALGRFFAELDTEIAARQALLRELMKELDLAESSVRQTAAWLAEKISRFKLGATGASDPLSLFESLEALYLGISGQRALWLALAEIAPHVPAWSGTNFERLAREAQELADSVEEKRLELAATVLLPDDPVAPVGVVETLVPQTLGNAAAAT